jgi:hypothetical protein
MKHLLEATQIPRLIVLIGLLGVLLSVAFCSGCATVEDYAEAHPRVIAGASVAALAVGGILVARNIAHSGRTIVVKQPSLSAQCAANYAECVR